MPMVVQLSMTEMYGDISRRSNAGLKDAMSEAVATAAGMWRSESAFKNAAAPVISGTSLA